MQRRLWRGLQDSFDCDYCSLELYSRNGNLLNGKFPVLVDAIHTLPVKRFMSDGEIVALDEEGRHSFQLLQRYGRTKAPTQFHVFDLLHFGRENLMKFPLTDRRERLENAFRKWPERVRLSPVLSADVPTLLQQIREFGFEGLVAKKRQSMYEPGKRSGAWLKHKTQQEDEFVIGGYIPGNSGLEQLVVGEYQNNRLLFVESVKNGFIPATRREVLKAIEKLEVKDCPFANLPEKRAPHSMDAEKMKEVRWVKPKIHCEIAFNERTPHGHLRHSKFLRLRPPETVILAAP
jgi:bifunctional non-homologous end joining protein LigD